MILYMLPYDKTLVDNSLRFKRIFKRNMHLYENVIDYSDTIRRLTKSDKLILTPGWESDWDITTNNTKCIQDLISETKARVITLEFPVETTCK